MSSHQNLTMLMDECFVTSVMYS